MELCWQTYTIGDWRLEIGDWRLEMKMKMEKGEDWIKM